MPSKLYRHCTRELKIQPITKFAKDYFQGNYNYIEAIGIRADEKHRISSKFYPLLEYGITKEHINQFWSKQPFRLNLKDYEGNCDLCFLKSKRKRLTILFEHSQKSDWWNEMENKFHSEYQPFFDTINKNSVQDLINESKKPFRKVLDIRDNPQLFDLNFDIEFQCLCNNS